MTYKISYVGMSCNESGLAQRFTWRRQQLRRHTFPTTHKNMPAKNQNYYPKKKTKMYASGTIYKWERNTNNAWLHVAFHNRKLVHISFEFSANFSGFMHRFPSTYWKPAIVLFFLLHFGMKHKFMCFTFVFFTAFHYVVRVASIRRFRFNYYNLHVEFAKYSHKMRLPSVTLKYVRALNFKSYLVC